MVFWCRLFLSIAAISTSAAGPLDKSIKDLGHGLEARVNLDTSDEFPSSGDPTTDYDSILPFDTGSLSDSFLPVDSSTNLGQSLPTVPYLMSAGLSNPEGSYHPDGSNQVPDLTVAGGILFAQAGKESFQCTLNSVICCKGQSDGKVKPCHFCKLFSFLLLIGTD